MNEHTDHGHVAQATDPLPYFPAAEWDQFKQDDIQAGKSVIVLISAIFTIGLILYSIVAIATAY